VLSEEGKNAASIKLDEEVLETCRKLGNKLCMANALNNIGIVLKDEADFAGAQRRYELCLELRREIGDRVGESAAVNNVAVLLYEQGKLAAAKSMYEQTLAIARDLGQKRGIARALTNISMVIEDQGDLAGARRIEEESVAIRRELGDKNGLALALTHFAEVLLYQGDLAGATQTDDEQIAMHRETGNQSALASALFIKGKILTAQGRLADGRKAHEEALAIRRRLDEHLRIPDSILDLAALSIEEGHGDEAERRTREVRVEILKQKLPETGRLALAHAVLARALLAQGRIAEAGKEIGTAESLSSTAENSRMRFDAGIAAARIHVAQGNRKAAGELQSLATESAKRGFVGYQLEAQLALGEAEMKFGPAESGLADLTSVEKDAAAKGYVLIARKAHAARGGR
jgi:tetratricopeptide (TPR) repeat protein